MNCSKCGKEVQEEWEYCRYCGEKINEDNQEENNKSYFCNKCGNKINLEDSFCNKCGNQLEKAKIKANDNENSGSITGSLKSTLKIGKLLYYVVGMGIASVVLTIFCGFSSFINWLSILFVIIGFIGGLTKSIFWIGKCPYCNREIEIPAENVINAGRNSSCNCPLCDKKIIL